MPLWSLIVRYKRFDLFILETGPWMYDRFDETPGGIYFLQIKGCATLKRPRSKRERERTRDHKSRETRVNCIVPFCSTLLMKRATRLAYYSSGVTRDHLFAGYTGFSAGRLFRPRTITRLERVRGPPGRTRRLETFLPFL